MWVKSANFNYGTGGRMYTLIGYHAPEYISDETKKLEVWYEGENLTHFISWRKDLIQSAQEFCNEDAKKRNLKAAKKLVAEEAKTLKLELNGYSYSFEEAQETNNGWAVSLMCDGACVARVYGMTKREAQLKAFNWLLDLHEAKDAPMRTAKGG